ncbi:restriction endonuclease subunit S [Pseudomonas viridiflava]|uniref:restriction endonuclease subunit S n=1 Tax=Pseudomonas viridiflava TaxID=33069 RepID=UPI0039B85A9C
MTPGEVSRSATKFLYGTNEHISASGLAGSGANLLPPGSLMITTRATLGARAINVVPMATNQGFKSIIFKHAADSDFYLHFFVKVQPELVRRASGTTFLEISAAEFAGIEVPSPRPDEKRLITEILDTLDAAIHETEAIIAKLKAVNQGLLHDLLTRGIDANGELRPPQAEAPQLYKESSLGWIPKEWSAKKISEIADVKSGSTPSREQANRYFSALGVPWVKTQDLNEDLMRETDESITVTALRETSCSLLPEGTVLVAMYGGWEQIGRTALLAIAAATNQAVSALTFRSIEASPEFALRALQHGRPRWQRVAASTRKDPNITKTDVLAFDIPWPKPYEQREIARRMRASLDRLEYEAGTLKKLRHQKSGLMDDLLTGRVRVTSLLAEIAQQKGSA